MATDWDGDPDVVDMQAASMGTDGTGTAAALRWTTVNAGFARQRVHRREDGEANTMVWLTSSVAATDEQRRDA